MEAISTADSSSSSSRSSKILHYALVGELSLLKRHYDDDDDDSESTATDTTTNATTTTSETTTIIRRRKRNNDIFDKNGSTPLHYAAGNGHISICIYLLEDIKIDVNSTSLNNGRTALHWAARNGQTSIVKLLITNYNAIVDYEANGQVTPLQLAIWKCHIQTAKVLVNEFNANPKFINSWGCSVAHWLGKCTIYSDFISLQQQQDDDTNNTNNNGNDTDANINMNTTTTTNTTNTTTAIKEEENDEASNNIYKQLMLCCNWLFHECQISYTIPNTHGQTPLHKAAFAGNLPVVQYLVLQLGIIDNIRDNMGNNAADCAERTCNIKTAYWLRRYASPILFNSLNELNLSLLSNSITLTSNKVNNNDNTENSLLLKIQYPPKISEIRKSFIQISKQCHPDRINQISQQQQQTNEAAVRTTKEWSKIRDAYCLLIDWWKNPEQYDFQIKFQSKNIALLEYPLLLWYSSWHEKEKQRQQQQTTIDNISNNEDIYNKRKQKKKKKTNNRYIVGNTNTTTATTTNTPKEIIEFEIRLFRLLNTNSFRINGLPISQLPKEYLKNWHIPIPKSKTYGCKKLINLIQTYCSTNIYIEYRENNQQPLLWIKTKNYIE